MALLLQAAEVTGPLSWRWLLREEASGALLADHQVCLDPAAEETVRFADLYGYVRWHAAPDRRVCDESRIVAQASGPAGCCWVRRSPPRRSRRRR